MGCANSAEEDDKDDVAVEIGVQFWTVQRSVVWKEVEHSQNWRRCCRRAEPKYDG